MVSSEEVAQPIVSILAPIGQPTQVAGRVTGDTLQGSSEQIRLGAEVLEDHRLRHPDARGDVRHAGLLIAGAGEQRDGRVEDRPAPRRSTEPSPPWSITRRRQILRW